ncbi:Hypothetical protein SCF082_LOCUS12754 [Durusdinium trenchii]|uniref:Diacylglycerol O-acyltransferase n=1 Tax=Durusdinium trenchii TaxID=1381693 RepID=A0ABP0JMV9_9DINO
MGSGGRPRALSALSNIIAHSTTEFEEMRGVITVLLRLDRQVAVERAREAAVGLLDEKHSVKFRSRIEREGGDKGNYIFVEVPRDEVDMKKHVREVDGVTVDGLEGFVAELLTQAMPFDQVQWEFLLLPDAKAAVVRVHHAVADGISLAVILHELLAGKKIDFKLPRPASARANQVPWWQRPIHSLRVALYHFAVAFKLPTIGPDTQSMFSRNEIGHCPKQFVLARSTAVPLDGKIKEIKAALGGTVNDIVVGALSGMFHDTLVERDPAALASGTSQFQLMCTCNTRTEAETRQLFEDLEPRNQWVFLPVRLPVCSTSPSARLVKAKQELDDLKRGPLVPMLLKLLLPMLSRFPVDFVMDDMRKSLPNASATMTIVPGPPSPVSYCGATVLDMDLFMTATTSTFCALISYNGKIKLCLTANGSEMGLDAKDVGEIAARFPAQIDAMHADLANLAAERRKTFSWADLLYEQALGVGFAALAVGLFHLVTG